jgi:hypothetical protein
MTHKQVPTRRGFCFWPIVSDLRWLLLDDFQTCTWRL